MTNSKVGGNAPHRYYQSTAITEAALDSDIAQPSAKTDPVNSVPPPVSVAFETVPPVLDTPFSHSRGSEEAPNRGKIEFFFKNFAALSGTTIAVASVFTMLFIFSYLSVCDYALIQVLEYQDILKFMLIGSVILLSIIGFIEQVGSVFVTDIFYERQPKWIVWSISFFVFLSMGLIIWSDFKNPNEESPLRIYLVATIGFTLLLIYIVGDASRRGNLNSIRSIYIIFLVSGFFVYDLGKTCGYYTAFRSPFHKIIIDEKQNFRAIVGARVFLLTSHHDVFIVGDRVETFPTESVREMSVGTNFQSSRLNP